MANRIQGAKTRPMSKISGMSKREKPARENPPEPGPAEETIFSAVLFVSQIIKEMVILTVESKEGSMHQTQFTFDRALLPKDYAYNEKRKYSLVVKRIK